MRRIIVLLCVLCFLNILKSQSGNFTSETMNDTTNNLILDYRVREPKVIVDRKKAILLLHGYGSNEADLFSLADQFPNDFYIICPRGKFTLSKGSYAWYNVDFSTGKPVYDLVQEKESREALITFLQQIKQVYQLEEVYLGGFSQGGIMSFSIGLTHPELVKGIMVMSGRLLSEIKPLISGTEKLSALKVFLAHGTQDNMLPVAYAREAKAFAATLPVTLTYAEYPMGHQISAEEIRDLNAWLAKP